MLEIPVVADPGVVVHPVTERRFVAEVAEQIVVDRAREGPGDCARLRIIARVLTGRVRLSPDEPRVDSADDLPPVAQQLTLETVRLHSEIRLQDVLGGKTGQSRHPLSDGLLLLVADRRTLLK